MPDLTTTHNIRKVIYALVLLLCTGVGCAARPDAHKSKAYNFGDPGVDAVEITLDANNVLYVWREVHGGLVDVAHINNFCEPVKRKD